MYYGMPISWWRWQYRVWKHHYATRRGAVLMACLVRPNR